MVKFMSGLLLGIMLWPAVLLPVFATGNFPVAATTRPSQWESKLAQFVLANAIARQAPVRKNPLEPREEIFWQE